MLFNKTLKILLDTNRITPKSITMISILLLAVARSIINQVA